MKRTGLTLLVVWLWVGLAVAHKFRNGMAYDDEFVLRGPLIHHPERLLEVFGSHAMLAQGHEDTQAVDTYRPLSIVTFFWDAWLAGTETWSYHLTNLLAHLTVVGLLFALAREMVPKASLTVVAFACLFFGLSPQLAEAHVWINGRSDPFAAAFGLAGIVLWRRALRQKGNAIPYQLLAGTLFFFGLLCKEVLLLVAPALLLWPETEAVPLKRRLVRPAALLAACVGYAALRIYVLHGVRATHDAAHVRTAIHNLPILWLDGLSQMLLPTKLYLRSLRDEYRLVGTGPYVAVCIGLLVLIAAAWLGRARYKVTAWSLVWSAGTLAPAALISALLWPGFGRYLYLPCVGLALGICELLAHAEQWLERRKASDPRRSAHLMRGAQTLLGAYLLSQTVNLASVVLDWESDQRLYPAIIRDSPTSPHGYGWVGMCAARAGHFEEAKRFLSRALELGGPEVNYSLALMRVDLLQNNRSSAIARGRKALQQPGIRPGDAERIRDLLAEGPAP